MRETNDRPGKIKKRFEKGDIQDERESRTECGVLVRNECSRPYGRKQNNATYRVRRTGTKRVQQTVRAAYQSNSSLPCVSMLDIELQHYTYKCFKHDDATVTANAAAIEHHVTMLLLVPPPDVGKIGEALNDPPANSRTSPLLRHPRFSAMQLFINAP